MDNAAPRGPSNDHLMWKHWSAACQPQPRRSHSNLLGISDEDSIHSGLMVLYGQSMVLFPSPNIEEEQVFCFYQFSGVAEGGLLGHLLWVLDVRGDTNKPLCLGESI